MGILNNFKIGPKILGGYVIAGVAMAILAYMLLSSISGLNTKFNFLVHHDTPVLTNATGAFVAKSGSDSNAGTKTDPYLTISYALANAGGRAWVVVAHFDGA